MIIKNPATAVDLKKNQLEWLAALEGDKYTQARKRLRNGDRFCCLGVMCDLVDHSKWVFPEQSFQEFIGAFTSTTMPPDTVLADFGMDESTATDYATKNDAHWTFRQLAYNFRQDNNLWDNYVPQEGDKRDTSDFEALAKKGDTTI